MGSPGLLRDVGVGAWLHWDDGLELHTIEGTNKYLWNDSLSVKMGFDDNRISDGIQMDSRDDEELSWYTLGHLVIGQASDYAFEEADEGTTQPRGSSGGRSSSTLRLVATSG